LLYIFSAFHTFWLDSKRFRCTTCRERFNSWFLL